MSTMNVEDALKVAAIFEADDIISVAAMSCRVLRHEILQLRQQLEDSKLEMVARSVKLES